MSSKEGLPTVEPAEVKQAEVPSPTDDAPARSDADAMPGESMAPSSVNMVFEEPPEKSNMQKLGQFFYNSETGRVLGRGGISWLQVFVFYIVYYFFIFTYFFICVLFLIQFSGDNKPDMTGSKAPVILSRATGLSVFPTAPKTIKASEPKERIRSSTIYYDMNVDASWEVYSKRLHKTITSIGAYNIAGGTGDCTEGNNYGYKTGEPCILLRFNRVFDWKPNSMEHLEKYLKDTYKQTHINVRSFVGYLKDLERLGKDDKEFLKENVGIQCTRDGGEQTAIGALEYFPDPGIKVADFVNGAKLQPGKIKDKAKRWDWTPYILVQFKNPLRNTFIPVICKAFEKNMNLYNSREGVGAVRFSLFILDKSKPNP